MNQAIEEANKMIEEYKENIKKIRDRATKEQLLSAIIAIELLIKRLKNLSTN